MRRDGGGKSRGARHASAADHVFSQPHLVAHILRHVATGGPAEDAPWERPFAAAELRRPARVHKPSRKHCSRTVPFRHGYMDDRLFCVGDDPKPKPYLDLAPLLRASSVNRTCRAEPWPRAVEACVHRYGLALGARAARHGARRLWSAQLQLLDAALDRLCAAMRTPAARQAIRRGRTEPTPPALCAALEALFRQCVRVSAVAVHCACEESAAGDEPAACDTSATLVPVLLPTPGGARDTATSQLAGHVATTLSACVRALPWCDRLLAGGAHALVALSTVMCTQPGGPRRRDVRGRLATAWVELAHQLMGRHDGAWWGAASPTGRGHVASALHNCARLLRRVKDELRSYELSLCASQLASVLHLALDRAAPHGARMCVAAGMRAALRRVDGRFPGAAGGAGRQRALAAR